MRTTEETGESITRIVAAMNSVDVEELDSGLKSLVQEEALGPLLDPTLWSYGGKFEVTRQTQKVLNAIKAFKVEVSGIGYFQKVG